MEYGKIEEVDFYSKALDENMQLLIHLLTHLLSSTVIVLLNPNIIRLAFGNSINSDISQQIGRLTN